MSLITVDQPFNPNIFMALFLPNFTRSVELPVEGGGGAVEEATVTVVDWVAESPDPVHVKANVVFAVRLPVLWEPEVDLLPDHPPEAVHEVAFVEFHVSVAALPEEIEFGLAVMLTVGAAGGGTLPPDVS